jgi:hypothetical protein
MLEEFKLAGGLAGIVSAVFLVVDRWLRGRPLAWVTAKKAVKSGANSFSYLRIQNPGPADVFIKRVCAYPPIYGVLKDQLPDEVAKALDALDEGDVKAMADIDVNVLLWQGQTYDLPIFEFPKPVKAPNQSDAAEVPQDQPVRFVIYWRKTSSTWLRQVPVRIFTSTRDIESIAAAVATQQDRVP